MQYTIRYVNRSRFISYFSRKRSSYQYNKYHWSNEAEDEVVVRA